MKDSLKEYRIVLENIKKYERDNRIRESMMLSPEYDYLSIDDEGYLVEPYNTLEGDSYTYDKVVAAGTELGKKRLLEADGKYGKLPYYKARNEINERVGRKAIYSDNDFVEEMDRINNFMRVRRKDYYDKY